MPGGQASRWDAIVLVIAPGNELPGYFRSSPWDGLSPTFICKAISVVRH
jgi:hypothetical protein